MKKLTALLLILCLLLPMAACGAKEEPTQPSQPSQPSQPTEPTAPTTDPTTPADPTEPTAEPTPEPEKQWLPLVEPAGSVTLTIGILNSANVTDYVDNYETRWYEEQTGIRLEFQQFTGSSSDCATQVALMIASGETLPDIFCGFSGISKTTGAEYGAEGYFVDLTDYFKDPDMTHFTDEDLNLIFGEEKGAAIKAQLLGRAREATTGGIYSFPSMEDVPMDSPVCHAYINEDWLKKLNLEVPHTLDELYNVLVHFRDDDPNGNGKKDEIPMTGRNNANYVDCVEWICNAFLYTEFTTHFNVENGRLYAPYDQPEYRQALCFIRKLVDEGLLTTLFFTQSANELKSVVSPSDNVYTVGIACGHPDLQWLKQSDSVRHYIAVGPLADATGKGGYGAREYYSMSFNTFITADCKEPELAFRLLDFMNAPDSVIRQRWGAYELDWVYSDGKGQSSAGNTPYIKLLNPTMWSEANNSCWHHTHGICSEYRYSYEVSEFDPNDWDSCRIRNLIDNYELYLAAGEPEEVFYFADYNADEVTERADFTSDLTSYITKSRSGFICGNLDPNNDTDWNTYLANLKNLDYYRWIEIAQAAWDRGNQGSNYISY